ncbi:MAG: hypothetical protein ACLVLH_09105 [Eisenbergiella massiliensis]
MMEIVLTLPRRKIVGSGMEPKEITAPEAIPRIRVDTGAEAEAAGLPPPINVGGEPFLSGDAPGTEEKELLRTGLQI